MIIYRNNIENIFPEMVTGFFSPGGWKEYPSPEKFLKILENSQHKILAVDDERNIVAGFINAVSDKILTAYIPLLEVLPEYQNKGIGSLMMDIIETRAKKEGAIEIALDTAEGAAHLIRYYKKRGYRFIEYVNWEVTNYRSVIMSKKL